MAFESRAIELKKDSLEAMAMATAGTPSVRLWDDVARAYATGVPQVRRPRRNVIPSDDEDQGTPTEPSIDSMPPPFHAKANYADVVPPASHTNPHMEDWEASSSDASITTDPALVAKEADKNPVGPMRRSAEDVSDVETAVPLKNATVFVPLSKDTITDTGVPSHLVVPYTGKAKSTSYYICTYPTCEPPKGFVQKAAAHNHLRRAHLGHALGCLYCVGWRVWRIQGWKEHMLTKHPSLPQFPTGTMLEGLRRFELSVLEKLRPFVAPPSDAALATSSAAASFMHAAQAYMPTSKSFVPPASAPHRRKSTLPAKRS